jgi:sterol desaturase/sphingolipid hydroxylase (fatty acid hydroxylase superfamily)
MSATLVVQVLALAVGLGCGVLWPRRQKTLFTKESYINLLNGALLYPARLGLGLLGLDQIKVGLIPVGTLFHPALQFLFLFLMLDFTRYWVHYADHRVPWLWSFHRVHHSAESMDSTVGFRMHFVDFLQLTAIPVVLFGLIFDVSAFAPWTMPAALSVGIVADAFEHSNMEFKLDSWWKRLWFASFNNPLFHSWHHTRDGNLKDGNYANALPLWDRLFGTDVTSPEPPALFGIDGDQRIEMSWIGLQLLTPRRTG